MANKAKKRGRSWRVQVYDYTDEAGKKHLRSFTAPTKAEAELLAAEFMRTKRERVKAVEAGTVGSLVAQYIEMMEPTLSPSTITVYRRAQHNAFPDLMQMPVAKLTAQKVQAAINAEVARPKKRTGRPLSPKTIRNERGGWKTPAVMKTHYQQTLNEKRRSVDAHINDYFESITMQITKTAEKR